MPISLRLAKATLQGALAMAEEAADDYFSLAMNQVDQHSLATISHLSGGVDVFTVHSLVRYTMMHADPAVEQAGAMHQKLRAAAVGELIKELQGVGDVRNHGGLQIEIAQARFLGSALATVADAFSGTGSLV